MPLRKVLVVSAWEPELTRFRALATAGTELAVLGVGLVDAAVEMTRCIARHAPSRAYFLGTGGSLAPERLPVLDVTCASRVKLVDAAVGTGDADLPGPMVVDLALDGEVHDELLAAGARSVTVATTVGITTSDRLASRLAEAFDVEHLEAFAFARACAAHQVPCGVVLGIANPVGSLGREAWRANHERASANAAEVLAKALATSPRT